MRNLTPIAAMASLIVLAAVVDALFAVFHVHFSSAVFGLLVLLGLIVLRRRVDTPLARAAHGLLRWFPFFFVPASVGVMEYAGTLRNSLAGVVAALVLSTLLGIAVAAVVGSAVASRMVRKA